MDKVEWQEMKPERFVISFGSKRKAAMAAAKLKAAGMSGLDAQVQAGAMDLDFTDRETLVSALEILSPPGISADPRAPAYLRVPEPGIDREVEEHASASAMSALYSAHLSIEEAVRLLGDAETYFLGAGMGAEVLAARAAGKQLDAFLTEVLERKLNVQAMLP